MREVTQTLLRKGAFVLPAAMALSGAATSDAMIWVDVPDQGTCYLDQSVSDMRLPITTPQRQYGSAPARWELQSFRTNGKVVSAKQRDPSTARQESALVVVDWVNDAFRDPQWLSASEQLEYVSTLEDGWQGEDSQRADNDALTETRFLLMALEDASVKAPLVGLDPDGQVVLTWSDESLTGSLSVFGDGTFSYYAEGSNGIVSDGEAAIYEEIDAQLIQVLMA
jgi:hypothetical protein